MAENRLTVDELYEQLRSQGYSDLNSVKYAILETSGQLSILPYTRESPITPQIAQLNTLDHVTLPILIINDGRLLEENLTTAGLDQTWLQQELARRKIASQKDIFIMTVDENGSVVCIKKEEQK